MAATNNSVGIAHLTVVPTNAEADVDEPGTDEGEDDEQTADE